MKFYRLSDMFFVFISDLDRSISCSQVCRHNQIWKSRIEMGQLKINWDNSNDRPVAKHFGSKYCRKIFLELSISFKQPDFATIKIFLSITFRFKPDFLSSTNQISNVLNFKRPNSLLYPRPVMGNNIFILSLKLFYEKGNGKNHLYKYWEIKYE